MTIKDLKNLLLLWLLVLIHAAGVQAQSAEKGKEIFEAKACAACHARDFKTDLVGPALAGVRGRWEKIEDLYNWVRNSNAMIAEGHEYGTALFEKYNKTQMLPFPDLTDEDIESILLYVESVTETAEATPTNDTSQAPQTAVIELPEGIDAALISKGEEVFDKNGCMACHAKDMKTDLVGPALSGVEDRWENKEDLYKWIRNSSELIASGHPYANQIFEKFNKTPMLPYPNLTDEEIEALLAFIRFPQGLPSADAVAAGEQLEVIGKTSIQKKPFLKSKAFIVLLLLLATGMAGFLAMIVAKLKNEAEEKEFGVKGQHNLMSVLFNRSILKFATFAFVVFGVYFTAVKAMNLGRQQNYEPDQPIQYSHKVHAGDNKIDCQFCHDGARRSKHATIPGTNTCMKCHMAIKNGSQYGTAEITKIYASNGYDPNTNRYIENYEELNQDEIKQIYTTWIAKQNADFDSYKINQQWEDIVESLTNVEKERVQGPIEWIRIHNLPDHVYFNHAQHVEVGKIDCQVCHGPIQEMEVVRQYAPLSMGWCINCHRETEVDFVDNPYYENYVKYHEEIAAGIRDAVTVEEIGGLDCQKCHY